MKAPRATTFPPDILVSSEVLSDPHTVYHLLRYEEPIHWNELLGAWVLTRYRDVVSVLRDPRMSSAARRPVTSGRLPAYLQARMRSIDNFLGRWVLNMDGARHAVARKLLNRHFSVSAIESMTPRIAAAASDLLDSAVADELDVIRDFAHPLPVRIISEMVGIPPHEVPLLLDWFAQISEFFELGPADERVVDMMNCVIQGMSEKLESLLRDDWASSPPPLVADLLNAERRGELTRDDVLSTLVLILFSGHESTRGLIGNAVLALLSFPEQRSRLLGDPGLIGAAVEEFLRFDGPFMRQDRIALEDVTLDGRTIQAGQHVMLVLGAANRDPERFPNPDHLLIDRPDNKHVAFGAGPHYCLGAHLARCEAAAAVLALFRRFPRLRLVPGSVRWRSHFNHRGLRTLHVNLGR